MNRSSPRGLKLTTVMLAVAVLAVSAFFSNSATDGDKDIVVEQSN